MATSQTRSIFLSREPLKQRHDYTKSLEDDPTEFNKEFLYICSESYPSYSIDYQMTAMGIMGRGTKNAIVIDSMSGAIGRIDISGIRMGDATYGSNKFFMEEILRMRSIIQLKRNAYILRIYNASMINKNGVKDIGDTYIEFYVYIKDVNLTYTAGKPRILNVSLGLVQRNALKGFSVYSG